MNAPEHYITKVVPNTTGKVVNRYLCYPDTTGKRVAAGGLRGQGNYKASMPDKPLVTIVTVCFNSAKTIEQCIESVLAQTYPNIEYIIIDAASTDGTQAIIERHSQAIDYYVSEPDRGLYHAMNKGLALASGDYILMLNSDDWYVDTAVEELVKAQLACGKDFVSSLAYNVDAEGSLLGTIRSLPYDAGIRLRMPLRHETMLVSRALYEAVGGYDETYRIIADFDLTLRLYLAGFSHFELPRPLMYFRNTGVSSTALGKLFAERRTLLSRQFPSLDRTCLEILGKHGQLAPDNISLFFSGHLEGAALLDALRAYIADLKSIGHRRWSSFSFPQALPVEKRAAAPRLRIATFVARDTGGAATGTQRRVEALRRHGADARIYSLVSESGLPYVYRIRPTALEDETREAHVWQKVIDLAIRPARQLPGYQAAEMFSLPASVVDFRKVSEVFEQSDVVHLHWMVGMFDYEHAGEVLADKPMTWTLADMNAFTGGCHYSEGCEEFKRECRNCPLLGGDNDLAHRAWQTKKTAYDQLKHLHIICPSKWMADLARSSSLFGDKPVHYIPNAFPVDRFSPTNKTVARLALGLPTDKKLLIFGAESLTQVRKGGDKLKAALELLQQAGRLENVEIITFGKNTIELPVPVHGLGHIADESYLAQAYSAADGFLFPSLEDNAPLTVGESLLCGTPVVTFPVGNVPDLVQHTETGYIARYLDIDDFAKGIEWILSADSKTALQRSMTCRIRAARFHDPALAVQRHMAVYAAAMSRD